MDNEKNVSLEEMFGQIENIISELENPEIDIEDAFSKYENGMKILKECNSKIDTIEKKVLVISGNGELDEFQ